MLEKDGVGARSGTRPVFGRPSSQKYRNVRSSSVSRNARSAGDGARGEARGEGATAPPQAAAAIAHSARIPRRTQRRRSSPAKRRGLIMSILYLPTGRRAGSGAARTDEVRTAPGRRRSGAQKLRFAPTW